MWSYAHHFLNELYLTLEIASSDVFVLQQCTELLFEYFEYFVVGNAYSAIVHLAKDSSRNCNPASSLQRQFSNIDLFFLSSSLLLLLLNVSFHEGYYFPQLDCRETHIPWDLRCTLFTGIKTPYFVPWLQLLFYVTLGKWQTSSGSMMSLPQCLMRCK